MVVKQKPFEFANKKKIKCHFVILYIFNQLLFILFLSVCYHTHTHTHSLKNLPKKKDKTSKWKNLFYLQLFPTIYHKQCFDIKFIILCAMGAPSCICVVYHSSSTAIGFDHSYTIKLFILYANLPFRGENGFNSFILFPFLFYR